MSTFPFYTQQDQMDCGATCLRMVCKHYSRTVPIQQLRRDAQVTKFGVNMLGLSDAENA